MTARSPLLTLYDRSLSCRGFILDRGRGGFEAYDINTKSLGIFPTRQAAIDAAFEAAK